MNIVIVGAGISGLSLAFFLQKQDKNHSITVLERDRMFDSERQGFSLTMQKKTRDIMKKFNLFDEVVQSGHPSEKQIFYDERGSILYENANNSADRFNFPLPRQEIRRIFFEKLHPNTVVFGTKVTDVKMGDMHDGGDGNFVVVCHNFDEKQIANVKELYADVVIACDGINSTLRKTFLPNVNLNNLKLCNVYGITDLTLLSEEDRFFFNKTEVQVLDGHHRFFSKPFDKTKQMWELTWPLEENSLFSSIYNKYEVLINEKSGSYQEIQSLALEACKCVVKDWKLPELRTFLGSTLVDDVIVHPLSDFDPKELDFIHLATVFSKNGILFLGDTLHPMSPYIGMGANEALYDSYMLAESIRVNGNPLNFYSEMIKRASKTVLRSRENTEFYHTPGAKVKETLWKFKNWKY